MKLDEVRYPIQKPDSFRPGNCPAFILSRTPKNDAICVTRGEAGNQSAATAREKDSIGVEERRKGY